MPLINVRLIEGVFTPEQKTQIAERLTDAMVSVEGENMRGVTWCVIDEVKSGDWAIGGQCLTPEAVTPPAAGPPGPGPCPRGRPASPSDAGRRKRAGRARPPKRCGARGRATFPPSRR